MLSQLKNIDRRWIWIGLAILIVLLRIISSYFPYIVESLYSRGLFRVLRFVIDNSISRSPFPLLYVFLFLLMLWGVYKFVKRGKNYSSFQEKLLDYLFSTIAFVGGLVFFFILLWGFNYARIPLEKQLKIKPIRLTDEELKEEFQSASNTLFGSYANYQRLNKDDDFDLSNIENEIRKEVTKTLQSFGYPTPGRVRARLLKPKGILLRISTAGVYLPWVGECHIDAGLHPVQIPNVMAHEFAHGYGITDEGSCNFIALQTCLNSENPFFKYSASLSYWKTVASNYRRHFPEDYKKFKSTMPKGILDDIKAINDNLDKYPDIFPDTRDFFYNNYLKSQGISEGMKNYSRVILLEVAYKKTKSE